MASDDPPLERLPIWLILEVQEFYVAQYFRERERKGTGKRERRAGHRFQRHQPFEPPRTAAPQVPPLDWPRASPRRSWIRTGHTWGKTPPTKRTGTP